MEQFTYESRETAGTLETYEWDNIWWEKPAEAHKPRVLIIGDSISCGYRGFVNEELAGKIYADGLGTSKAADHAWYPKILEYMAAQTSGYRVVQFNNGLHGWHLSDEDEYLKSCERILRLTEKLFPQAKLITALTTPVWDRANPLCLSPRSARVLKRNESLRLAAEKLGAQVLDLYHPFADRPELFQKDGVHLKEEGYRLAAKLCAAMLQQNVML